MATTITPQRLQELLAKAKAITAAAAEKERIQLLSEKIEEEEVEEVDLSLTGISQEEVDDQEKEEEVIDILREISSGSSSVAGEGEGEIRHGGKEVGVAKQVTLNNLQQEFDDMVQAGRSVVLIGPAGCGKTTGVGVTTRNLISSGRISSLSTSTKWLQAGKPGAAILSYTRKAVNNIRHAVAEELKAHTLTIHKLLEFAPIFYEI